MEQTTRIEAFKQRQDYEYKRVIPIDTAKRVNKRQARKAWLAGGLVGAILIIVFQLIELFFLVVSR